MGAQRVCCVVALALVLVVCLHAGWAQGRVVEDNFNQHQTPLEFMAKFCYSDAGLPPFLSPSTPDFLI